MSSIHKTKDVQIAETDPRCDWEDSAPATAKCPTQPDQDLSELVGKHIIYTYANGWHYEYYFRNETAGDYRIASGIVADRWTVNQRIIVTNLGHGTFKVVWNEPTGTTVVLEVNFQERWLHGTVAFPKWVEVDGKKTVCYQNEHYPLMNKYRDEGPTYPIVIVSNFAEITFIEDCGRNNDNVIACPASELPVGYLDRRN